MPANSAFIHRPFTEHTRIKQQGVALAKLHSDVGFLNLGDYENATQSFDITREKIYSPQTPERSVVANLVTESSLTFSIELLQMQDMIRAVAYQSDPNLTLDQAQEIGKVLEVAQLGAGRIMRTGYREISNVTVIDDLANEYVAGTHFQFDAATGNIEIIEHFDGAERANVTLGFDCAEIAGRKIWGMGSEFDLRGEFMFRSTNMYGPRQLIEVWDGQFGLDGEFSLGSNSTDWGSVQVTIEAFAAADKPLAFRYGQVTDLPRAA